MDTRLLNDDWTVEYFEPEVDGFEMAPSAQAVPRLTDWMCEARFVEAGFFAWLQRRFDLSATVQCVRYIVQVEGAPNGTRVFVNDKHLADADGNETPLRIDITDYVSLGKNRLSMRLNCEPQNVRFEGVALLQIPCEDVR